MANIMKNLLSSVLLITFLILLVGVNKHRVNASRRHTPLLIEDDGSRRNRPAECLFGKTLRELGSTWFADLGPPFGVMYCIKCECAAVQKKRRIVARVQCRNIKNECPKPTCDEPILLPGRCCKTCPGDLYSPDVVQDLPQTVPLEEEERNMKHFAALLTGRTSSILKKDDMKSVYSTNNPMNIIATGRFNFHKKNLYYSFYVSEQAARPRSIQFINHMGNILEEHTLAISNSGPFSIYQNSTGKICGVWRRVPRDYRRLLRDDQMSVVLMWGGKYQAELAIAGQIGKYPALSTELYSSLLSPAPGSNYEQMNGSGGTAIVSTSSGVTSSIHMTIVLNGLFSPDDISDTALNIRLEYPDKKQLVLEDVQKVRKPAHDINVIEISSPVSVYDLRLLTRGKLTLIVESKRKPESLRIQGNVITRATCEVFQTLLNTHNYETEGNGLAWLYLNREGSLVYNVQTNNFKTFDTSSISLTDESAKRKTVVEVLKPQIEMGHSYGVLDKLGPRVLETLYAGDLAVNVGNDVESSLIHGKLVSRPVADARDSTSPMLMKQTGLAPLPQSVGMAWIAVDNDCNLHYEVTLSGISTGYQPLELYLEEMPIEAPNAPISKRLLEEFSGNYLEGFVLAMPSNELSKLETSVCYLEVRSKTKDEALLKSKLKITKVPSHCFPSYTDNDVPNGSFVATEHSDNNLQSAETKCYHSGRFFDEGEVWHSSLETCTMCSCDHKRVKCEPIKCPPLKCRKEDIVMKNGECCPTCASKHVEEPPTESKEPRGCNLGDQFYTAGSTWHPYLPPNGYDTCTTCTCDAANLEISCPRTVCPPLNCSEKVAYRPDKKACCKICPVVKQAPVDSKLFNPEEQKDQGSKTGTLNSPQSILENGGCRSTQGVHENGQQWHPVIATHGEQKCIFCKCKDGNISCDRKRCARSVCRTNNNSPRNKSNEKQQQQNSEDDCCQCNRSRRHHLNRRRMQEKQNKATKTRPAV